jgi:membrane-bound metal-dependent hydrolase YbcI (DUF457 family)
VDPVSHLLVGRCVAVAVRRDHAKTTGMTSALVLGSVLPDIDIVLVPTGFDRYLYAHAAGTHAVAGTIFGALLLAAVLRRLVKGSRFLILLIAAWIGTEGHVLADLADGSDIGVFEPLSPSVFGWHLFSMGDPFVLCGLAVAALAATTWPRYAWRSARLRRSSRSRW